MEYDDVLTRNEDQELAVRVVSATESATVVNPNDVYTRDEDGNLAIRVVGAGGGDSHNLGYYAALEDLEEAHPTAEAGDWAIVGSTDTVWVWDEEESAWTDTDKKGQVTSVNNQTGAVVLDAKDVNAIPQVTSMQGLSDGDIVQYVGQDTADYKNGYFYKFNQETITVYNCSYSVSDAELGNIFPDALPTIDMAKFVEKTGVNVNDFTSYMLFIFDGLYADDPNTVEFSLRDDNSYNIVPTIVLPKTNVLQELEEYGITFDNSASKTCSSYTVEINYAGTSTQTQTTINRINVQPLQVIPDSLEQWSSLPTASADYLGVIVQYVGATGGGLTNGYIYKCTTDGVDYAWTQYDIQPTPVRSVNSKTGSVVLSAVDVDAIPQIDSFSGVTNGEIVQYVGNTTASYTKGYFYRCDTESVEVLNFDYQVDAAYVDTDTPSVLPNILSNFNLQTFAEKAGVTLSSIPSDISGWLTVYSVGHEGDNPAVELNISGTGLSVNKYEEYTSADGYKQILADYGFTFDWTLTPSVDTVEFNCSNISVSTESQIVPVRIDVQPNAVTSVNNQTGAVVLSPSDIGATSMNVPATMPTLAVADWNNSSQTVQVTGVTATNTIFVAPAPASSADYAAAGIVCTAQGAGTLTFTCDTVPSNAITVNVIIFN